MLTTLAAIMMEDSQTGQRYLQVKHFISRGIPASIITLLVVLLGGICIDVSCGPVDMSFSRSSIFVGKKRHGMVLRFEWHVGLFMS